MHDEGTKEYIDAIRLKLCQLIRLLDQVGDLLHAARCEHEKAAAKSTETMDIEALRKQYDEASKTRPDPFPRPFVTSLSASALGQPHNAVLPSI